MNWVVAAGTQGRAGLVVLQRGDGLLGLGDRHLVVRGGSLTCAAASAVLVRGGLLHLPLLLRSSMPACSWLACACA